MSRLLFVRHAESEANAIHSLDCEVPGPGLTELGHRQAGALVEQLSDVDITAIWVSTMARAQQTAAPLAAAHGLELLIEPDLRETHVGDLHPRNDSDALVAWHAMFAHWLADGLLDEKRPGGESATEVINRYVPVVRRIAASSAGTAVIVTHGAAMRLVLTVLCPEVKPLFALEHHVSNTGIVEVEFDGAAFRGVAWEGVRLGG